MEHVDDKSIFPPHLYLLLAAAVAASTRDFLQNNSRNIFLLRLQTMPKSTVFITGATGFIGAQVTASALRAGYNVKLSVRRATQISSLRRVFAEYPENLDFVVVPDYTTAEAFGSALQGVDYVIHVASPLPNGDEELVTPAVKGTVSVLEAALKVVGIRKVVITASVASLVPLDKYVDGFVVRGECCV
jgi:nucleoside-diphosphate-sugar epimerase